MKMYGKPLDLDYDIEDVVQAVQAATTQEKARVMRGLIHDMTFRRDGGEKKAFVEALGPTDVILLRDLLFPPKVGGYADENTQTTVIPKSHLG